MRFREVELRDVPWQVLDGYADRTFAQRKPWLDFLISIGAGQPVVARLEDGGGELGWFTGLRSKVAGLCVMGSPLKGWNTQFMGLNLMPGVSRHEAMEALWRFVRRKCWYLELSDVNANQDDKSPLRFRRSVSRGYLSDLSQTEDALFQAFSSACRRCVRKAAKEGVTVHEASPDGFAQEYYGQLEEVFAHQGLRPTYPLARVTALIERVHPSGDLMLLRACEKDGTSIATGIFAYHGRYSGFIGNGSVKSRLHLRPNQALHWTAMRLLKSRGVHWHDWGGAGSYKEAYGPKPIQYVTEYRSAVPLVTELRAPALRAYYWLRRQFLSRR